MKSRESLEERIIFTGMISWKGHLSIPGIKKAKLCSRNWWQGTHEIESYLHEW